MSAQADLRLTNLVSRGYTVAEARKKLGLDQPKPPVKADERVAPKDDKALPPATAPDDAEML